LILGGHEEYTALNNIALNPEDRFMEKPFRMSDLMVKLKELTVTN
jgi:hypothetical protein